MRNLLLVLLLANILYFLWDRFVHEVPEQGVAVISEHDLGPPLEVSNTPPAEAATSIGAVLGSGNPSDLIAAVGRSCVTIGPFKTAFDADTTLAEYENEGMRASVRTTLGKIFIGHWVQIHNIADRESGNAMIAKLQAGGLGDAYMVESEDEGLKISLGVFGEMNRAERIELQAKSLDFPADITPHMRETTVFFVDIGLSPGKGAGDIIGRYGEDKVLLRDQATCPRAD